MAMTWLDIAIVAIIALSALYGIVRGFIREVLSLAVWVAAFWFAFRYAPAAAVHLESYVQHDSARMVTAFVALFFAVLVVGMLVSAIIIRLTKLGGIGGPDRVLGAAFGVMRGVLVVTALVMVASITPLVDGESWSGSGLVGYFETLAEWSRDALRRGTGWDIPAPEVIQAPSGG
jgi:membrane protein required for colicin V production